MDADFLAELQEACEPIFVRQVEWTVTKPKPASPYSKAFSEWYAAYPLHTGKASANRAYMVAGQRIKVERGCDGPAARDILLEAAQAYAKSDVGQSEYCPHPTTWLRAGQWDDDRSAWNRPAEKFQLDPRSNISEGEVYLAKRRADGKS